jgi:SHS2 domain-containing protein
MPTEPDPIPDQTQSDAGFEEVEHTADWALRVRGSDLRTLLINAARGMNQLLVADPARIPHSIEARFELEAYDAESLLVTWLNELVFRAEVEGLVFTEFDLTDVTSTRLQAVVRGDTVAHLQKHIKAVTFHDLEIVITDDGLAATVVFDV